IEWLKKTPVIKLTDNSRLIVIDILRGNYKRNAIQSWQEASLVLGLSAVYSKTGDAKLESEIGAFIDRKLNSDGDWSSPIAEIDGVILGYSIIQIPWVDQLKLKPAYDALWDLIRELKGSDGTVGYKKHNLRY